MARRCPAGLLTGSSSRAAWLIARWPVPNSRRTLAVAVLFSHASTRLGRSLLARASCRPRNSARTSLPPPASRTRSRCRRLQRVQERGLGGGLGGGRGGVLGGGCPRGGRLSKRGGWGGVQIAHGGGGGVPPRISPPGPQPAHCARRFWQALHHGRPVAWEISQDALRPQIEQVTVDYSPAPVMRARLGRSCPTPAVAPPAALAGRDRPPAATGSIRSVIEQPRMSSSAIRIFRLSRSGRSATSR